MLLVDKQLAYNYTIYFGNMFEVFPTFINVWETYTRLLVIGTRMVHASELDIGYSHKFLQPSVQRVMTRVVTPKFPITNYDCYS